MFRLLSILLPLLLSAPASAQKNLSITGTVYDSASRTPVSDVTVTLFLQKDSALVSFSTTTAAGAFTFRNLKPGAYRLLATHVSYHNTSSLITLRPDSIPPPVALHLHNNTKMLDEVVVTREAPPVTISGDTIQYNAGSFRTEPNADVEQLLKKLPGVQVDRNGNIKAQGKKITRVLVDGKPFFGNDPKMATKNLPADAIDKVQVYEKRSEQAMLTGMDDGEGEHTLNLKLKKDRKNGMFGKMMGAGGRNRFESRLNANAFSERQQTSLLATANNTNAETFSFNDILDFNGGVDRLLSGRTLQLDESMLGLLSGSSNEGNRTVWSGGLNLNRNLGDKNEFTGHYFYNHLRRNTESRINRQYLLPDSTYFYRQETLSSNYHHSHRINGSTDIALDSFHSFKAGASFGYQRSSFANRSNYNQHGEHGEPGNKGFSNSAGESNGYNWSADLLFRKKYRKKGRTLSLSLQQNTTHQTGNNRFLSENEYIGAAGTLLRKDAFNQQIQQNSRSEGISGKFVYTEPLSKKILLEWNASGGSYRGRNGRTTYDRDPATDKFDRLNDSLTNTFTNRNTSTGSGLRILIRQKRYLLSAGLRWEQAGISGSNFSRNTLLQTGKTYHNLLPDARFRYNFSRKDHLVLQYQSHTNMPSPDQLQSIPNVSNPLYITEGNPGLKQEYTHSIQASFNKANLQGNRSLSLFHETKQTRGKITYAETMDALGVKRTRPVNTNGIYQFSNSISVSLPVSFAKGSWHFDISNWYEKGKQFVNGFTNQIRTMSISPSASIDAEPDSKTSVFLKAGTDYHTSSYSLNAQYNTRYFRHYYEAGFSRELPFHLRISSDFSYSLNTGRSNGFNTRIPLWNAHASFQFLRNRKGELKLSIRDILNKNTGITRSSNQNYIEDAQVNGLRRYALLRFTYSFTRMGRKG